MGCGRYDGQGVYCGLSTASEMFIYFTTQLCQYFSVFFLFALVSDEPEVFLPKYSPTTILHAAHFWRVTNENKLREEVTSPVASCSEPLAVTPGGSFLHSKYIRSLQKDELSKHLTAYMN